MKHLLLFTLAPFLITQSSLAHSGSSKAQIDQLTRIHISPESITITFSVTLNRPAAFDEVVRMDTNGDGILTDGEQTKYFDRVRLQIKKWLEVKINDLPASLTQKGDMQLVMPFTKIVTFEIKQPDGWESGTIFEFHNDNYLDVQGSISIQLTHEDAVSVSFNSLKRATSTATPHQRDIAIRYGDSNHKSVTKPLQPTRFAPAMVRTTLTAPIVSVVCLLAIPFGLFAFRRQSARKLLAVSVALTIAALSTISIARIDLPLAWSQQVVIPDDLEANQLFQQLHRNIYAAFDAKSEGEIYDTLAESLRGTALETIYDEVNKAKRASDDGVTRFSIRRVKPMDSTILSATGPEHDGFRVQYKWRVYGTVTHFGHTHARFNEYEATYLVAACQVDEKLAWRIVDVSVEQHFRMNPA